MGLEKKLPEGWRVTKLADFVSSKKGKKPKYVSSEQTVDFNIPYVNIKAFEKNIIDEYTNGEGCVFCDTDDFLMVWDGSRSGYVGRAIKGAIGSTLVKLSFPKEVFEKYAYYFLQSKYIEINTRAKGVGIPHVDPNLVWNYKFPLPAPNEQRQIVEKIEELFSELDKGIENLKTAQQQLKVYRQAVLKSAFGGGLADNSVNDKGLPIEWKLAKIKDVAITIGGYAFKSPEFKDSGIYQVIRMGNVRPGKLRLNESPVFIEAGETLLKKSLLKVDDLIITQTGTRQKRDYGFTALITKSNLLLNQRITAMRCSDKYSPKFLLYYTWTDEFKNQFFANETGNVGQGNVGMKAITDTIVPFPPISIQQQVVAEIESRLSICENIEETIINSLLQAESLKQSILKKAFEGELVHSDAKKEAKIVSINATRDVWQRKVLAGKIIFACHKERSFGTTKFQKLLYLCEQYSQLEFDMHYIKQTAGPLDAAFIYPFIREAEKSGWFVQETEIAPFHFEPLNGLGQLTNNYPKFFKSVSDKVNFIIGLLKDKNTDDSELVATIYAIWNNYIIQKQVLTIEALPDEVYDWSESKAKFTIPQILAMWKWMKEVALVPVGFGKYIDKA